jgi:glycosyltransferase involved in cell wall biosynthesis
MKTCVTVLLPVYNGMPYIVGALQSLLDQTENNIMIYALDDGSTDKTLEYLHGLMDPRIIIFSLSKVGLVEALNYGLQRVTTEYVARMDADDISDKHRIKKQIHFLDSNPDYVLVGGWIRYISENGIRKSWEVRVPTDHHSILKGMHSRQSAVFHATIMCRTKAVVLSGAYDPSTFPAEDYDLFFRLSNIGKLANLPYTLLDVRINTKSVISGNFLTSLKQYARSVERYSTTKISRFHHIYIYFDNYSALMYRTGLQYYLNSNLIIGYMLFLLSAIINPARFIRFINRRFIN